MAKNTEAQIRYLQKRLKKIFKIVASKDSMRAVGNYAVEDIQKRIRLGYGAPSELGKKVSLKVLKKHSKQYERYRKKNKGILDQTTRPGKQNLTFTGQLVRDLKLVKVKKTGFTVGHSNKKRKGDTFSNLKLSGWVQDAGRPYMNITDLEYKRLLRFYQNKIVRPKLAKV